MPEHRLVGQVLLNCVKPTHETIFGDVPNLIIENATKLSKDRKLWSSNRPSLRCKPVSGRVAIKKVRRGIGINGNGHILQVMQLSSLSNQNRRPAKPNCFRIPWKNPWTGFRAWEAWSFAPRQRK